MASKQQVTLHHPVKPTSQGKRSRKRAFHHKDKGGCRTCKGRHVKCDQTRPLCIRCRASGRECLGYTSAPDSDLSLLDIQDECLGSGKHKATLGSVQTNRLPVKQPGDRPRVTSISNSKQRRAKAQHFASMLSPMCDLDYTNTTAHEKEALALCHALTTRIHAERMRPPTDVWMTFIPQIAYTYPSLRHALVAIGTTIMPFLYADATERFETSYRKAMKYVNLAIKDLLDPSTSTILPKVVPVLVAHALWHFELIEGRYHESLMHIESAIRLASEFSGQCEKEAEIAILLVQCARATQQQLDFGYRFVLLGDAKTPLRVRKAGAVLLGQRTLDVIKVESLKLAFIDIGILSMEDKQGLLNALQQLRIEIECVLSQWQPEMTPQDVADGFPLPAGTIASPWLENLITGAYCTKELIDELSKCLPMFLSRIVQGDVQGRLEIIRILGLMLHQNTNQDAAVDGGDSLAIGTKSDPGLVSNRQTNIL